MSDTKQLDLFTSDPETAKRELARMRRTLADIKERKAQREALHRP